MSEEIARVRRSWMVIVLAFALSTVFYAVVGSVFATSASRGPAPTFLPALRWALYVAGAVALGAGILFFSRAVAAERLAPGDFQVRTIVSLALCESAAVFGIVLVFLGGTLSDYLPPGIAVVAVIAAYVLPRGLDYWRRLEGGRS